MNISFRGLKATILISAVLWISFIVVVHHNLVLQHITMDRNVPSLRHRTKPLLSLLCGNKTIDIKHRECAKRFEFIWNCVDPDPCFKLYGVDISNTYHATASRKCNMLKYLVYVERVCPEPDHAEETFVDSMHEDGKVGLLEDGVLPKARCRNTTEGLLKKMDECGKVCQWMKMRITNLQTSWTDAIKNVSRIKGMESSWLQDTSWVDNNNPYRHRTRLTILLHMGLLTKEYGLNFGEGALVGGPLGELVQWADLAAALELLGHELILSWSPERLRTVLHPAYAGPNSCRKAIVADIVYTDLVGVEQIQNTLGTLYHYRCRLRVLDVYGTEPEFNHPRYRASMGKAGTWGGKGLNPKQFFTHFPHSPDNSFLGFVIERGNKLSDEETGSQQALLYGKKPEALAGRGKEKFLEILHKYFPEIHATMKLKTKKSETGDDHVLPDYVINHGSLAQPDFLSLLRRSKVYVGLGWPVEGPAALEAIANGVTYLNPRFSPPRDSHEGKPTNRLLSSQNPYAEDFIGEPYVYTVDMRKHEEVEKILQKIVRSSHPEPKVTHEFSQQGFLERINAYLENQDFCTGTLATDMKTGLTWKRKESVWPPIKALKIAESNQGETCTSACARHNLTCEREFFAHINSNEVFTSNERICEKTRLLPDRKESEEGTGRWKPESAMELCHAPSFDSLTGACFLQSDPLLFSCACPAPGGMHRLCPCRTYTPEQIALYEGGR